MTERLKAVGLLLLAGLPVSCASYGDMDVYVPHACHGAAAPFTSYSLSLVDVPGFIEDVVITAARGALAAEGLDEAPIPGEADLEVVNTFYLIDRNPPPPEYADPMGEPVQMGTTNRFVAHLEVDVVDRRTERVIWTGAMYRAHAIQGGETFHDDRAVLMVRTAYEEMFAGLTTPCE